MLPCNFFVCFAFVHVNFCGFFFIHMSNIWIYVLICVCLAGWLAVLHGKDVGRYTQVFQSDLYIPAMLVGIIDFTHFMSLLNDLDLG